MLKIRNDLESMAILNDTYKEEIEEIENVSEFIQLVGYINEMYDYGSKKPISIKAPVFKIYTVEEQKILNKIKDKVFHNEVRSIGCIMIFVNDKVEHIATLFIEDWCEKDYPKEIKFSDLNKYKKRIELELKNMMTNKIPFGWNIFEHHNKDVGPEGQYQFFAHKSYN